MSLRLAVLVVFALVCAQVPSVSGQTYDPGPPPMIGPIQHETVEILPEPRSRTEVGIGEEVTCWVDPATWVDVDYLVDPYGQQIPVNDAMGTVTWSVSGPATVYPTVGTTTTVTVDLVDTQATVTVIATVDDSGTKGDDNPVELNQIMMLVFPPEGVQVMGDQNNQPPGWNAGPPNNRIGMSSLFEC